MRDRLYTILVVSRDDEPGFAVQKKVEGGCVPPTLGPRIEQEKRLISCKGNW